MEPHTRSPLGDATQRNARQLALLGILLQALHVLFGFTAIIGVIITQTRIDSTRETIYYSHLQWQFVTFWMALTGYTCGFYFWATQATPWIVAAVLALIIYRLAVSIRAWILQRTIDRWL